MKILIIENNLIYRILFRELFDETDHEYLIATNGGQGMKFLSQERYDLVISNIFLPYIDGISLYKAIKDKPKFVFLHKLSEKDLEEMKNKYFDKQLGDLEGKVQFIRKDIQPKELLEKLKIEN